MIIIFDHTTLDDRFLILKFSLKVGKIAIPLWYKMHQRYASKNRRKKKIKYLRDISNGQVYNS
ncbi:hypothetical protein [Hathewaya massiliensis]|uniref:hypothetical protein n=1 Tax=Hathewaya massiliensis TaxID=1964382 RepID=UPI001158AA25|nr:hypothetical protein [Hathewaya massiliensis]